MSQNSNTGFAALNVASKLCDLLARHNIVTPTPIQAQAIPVALSGKDLIGVAQTGTGKTLAFGVPMTQNLSQGDIGLVLAPTRELAQQISETYDKLGVSTVLIIGGASISNQVRQLRGRYQVIVATPGRLIDHLARNTVRLTRAAIVVLDEADRMLDMGFAPAIKRILDKVPANRQTLLFSATMPKAIVELAAEYMREPERVQTEAAGSASELVEQELYFVKQEEKQPLLWDLLDEHEGTVLVFARTRHGARKLAKAARTNGHTAAEIHADRSLAQRREALHGFKTGMYRVLVATDIAARGIDVKDISVVVNYDVPENPDDYIHRIGRTGRAGALGKAITIAIPAQARDIRDIENLLRQPLPISDRSTSLPRSLPPSNNKASRPSRNARPERKHESLRHLDAPPAPRHVAHEDRRFNPQRRFEPSDQPETPRPPRQDTRDNRGYDRNRRESSQDRSDSPRPQSRPTNDRNYDSRPQRPQRSDDRNYDSRSQRPQQSNDRSFRDRRGYDAPRSNDAPRSERPQDRDQQNSNPKGRWKREERSDYQRPAQRSGQNDDRGFRDRNKFDSARGQDSSRPAKPARHPESKPWERKNDAPIKPSKPFAKKDGERTPRRVIDPRSSEPPKRHRDMPNESFTAQPEFEYRSRPVSKPKKSVKAKKRKPAVAAVSAAPPVTPPKGHRGWSGKGKPKKKPR